MIYKNTLIYFFWKQNSVDSLFRFLSFLSQSYVCHGSSSSFVIAEDVLNENGLVNGFVDGFVAGFVAVLVDEAAAASSPRLLRDCLKRSCGMANSIGWGSLFCPCRCC